MLPLVATGMDLETVVPSELGHAEGQASHDAAFSWNLQK